MSLSQIPSRRKQRPSSLDEIEPISSYSKDNTEKSMQGSLYDCEMASMNTYGLSSNRSRARRRESISAKSRISSKNMIDFEEFTLENPNDNLLQTQILENNNSYLSSITTRNKEPEVIKETNEENCQDQATPAEFLRVDTDEKPYKSDKADETQPIVSPKAEDKEILPAENVTGNNDMILGEVEPESGIEEEKTQEKEDEEEKMVVPLREQNVNLAVKKGKFRHDNRFADRIMSFEDYSARRRSENIITSENTFEVEEKPDKTKFASEFRSLKDEVVTIQRDLKNSEAYNKKLEEYIHTQKVQIETILANFNAIGEENNALKKKLPEMLRKSAEQKKEVKQSKEEIYKDIDHIVSKKANKYYKQEMELNKEKYTKTFQNFEKIINDLHKQLEAKDMEVKELQSQNAIANSLARNMSSKSQSLFDQLHVSRTIGSNKEIKSPEFNSISKAQISEDRYLGGSCDEPNDIKSPRTLRDLNQQVSPTDMKYIQYMADISEKMDEMKRNEQKLTKRTTHSLKPQIPTGLPDKSLKGMSKEPRSFSSEPHKLTLQGSTFEETFLEDPKGSMIEASFDISTAKNSNKKDIDELSTFNLSPSKTKHMPLLKQERSKKSLPSSQNASQMNEMSMIHETLSENFVTESIHSKLAWEFQKQFGFGPKKSTDSAKLPSRGSKEDSQDRSQDRDYGYIEKMHRYIQGSKKKGSSSTSGSKMSYTDKTLSKDQSSLQRSKDESTSFTNNSSGNLKGKDYYFANSVSKGENANVLKTSNMNLPSSNLTTNQSLKPSRTLSNYDKPNDSYYKALPKNAEKKSRSATNSQDKIAKKDKPEGKGKGYEHSSLQTQSNDTIIYINSALDKMLDKGQQGKTYSLLEREKRFMKTQPYRKNDVMPDLDDMYPLPSQSDSDYNQIKLSTAPLSSYLQLARTGSSENPSSHTSLKTNILDIENKENFAEHPSRCSTSSRKGPKYSGQTSTQINLDEPAFYNAGLDKLSIPPKSVGEHTKGSGYKRPSTTSNSQARHHTPTTKVYLDVFPPGETKEQVMKIPKKVERIFPREMDEINLNTIDNFNNNKLMGKPRSSSNKASSNKSGTRGSQGYSNYPMYNNLILDEFGSHQPAGKTGKTPNYRSGTDQKSYEYMHQTDRENAVRKNKEEGSKYESENMPNGSDMYLGQPQSKNRRESYRPYNVYNYDSKKYMQ